MCAKVFLKKAGQFSTECNTTCIIQWKALNEFNVKRSYVGSAFCEWVLTSGREFKQGLRLKWNYLTNVH